MLKPWLEAFDESTHLKLLTLADAARAQKTTWTERQNLVVVGFWGVGTTKKRDTLTIIETRYQFA